VSRHVLQDVLAEGSGKKLKRRNYRLLPTVWSG
jgi:hypothetical protein